MCPPWSSKPHLLRFPFPRGSPSGPSPPPLTPQPSKHPHRVFLRPPGQACSLSPSGTPCPPHSFLPGSHLSPHPEPPAPLPPTPFPLSSHRTEPSHANHRLRPLPTKELRSFPPPPFCIYSHCLERRSKLCFTPSPRWGSEDAGTHSALLSSIQIPSVGLRGEKQP